MSSKVASAMGKENNEKSALLPRLRFPEFQGAVGWEVTRLKEIASSEASAIALNKLSLQSAGYPVYGADGIVGRVDSFAQEGSYIAIVKDGSGVGRLALLSGKSSVLSTLAYVKAHDNAKAKLNWLFYCLSTLDLRKYIKGSGIPHIYFSDYSNEVIGVPRPAEQQKIANCLSSLDELITAETQKLDALKTHKKGLMQQLFPREGETVPQLRFPEFRDAGEWEKKQIGDFQSFVTSGSRGWAAYYANQGSLFVRITNLTRESIYLDLANTKFVKLPQEASEGVRTQLKEFDLLISITADIGIIGYVDASVPSPAYINQHIALVRFDTSQVCSQYVSYFLASERSQRHFHASTDVGTKAGMNLLAVQQIQLVLPTLPEQQKIAAFLSSLDNLITDQNLTVNALKTHKKALMQQLFPVLDEVLV